MSPIFIIALLSPVLLTLNSVLGLLGAVPGAGAAAAPIQAAISSITSALGILGSLPIPNFR